MVAGSIQINGERFVIVPESEYDRMREFARELVEGDGPSLPKPDAKGNVPAIEYARATLARKLIRDRRRAGLTQAELASRAGMRMETVAKIESGKLNPGTVLFGKIHRALEKTEARR